MSLLYLFTGQERFQSITNRFYSDTRAVVVVYDVTGDDIVQDLSFWVREVNYYLLREVENGMPVLFVGNKKDLLQDHIPYRPDDALTSAGGDVRQLVHDLSDVNGFLRPFESSAMTGENVRQIFHTIASDLIKRKHIKPNITKSAIVTSRRMCSDSC